MEGADGQRRLRIAPRPGALARSRISAAALLVKVMAAIALGVEAGLDQARDLVRDDARLARAGAGEDQAGPVQVMTASCWAGLSDAGSAAALPRRAARVAFRTAPRTGNGRPLRRASFVRQGRRASPDRARAGASAGGNAEAAEMLVDRRRDEARDLDVDQRDDAREGARLALDVDDARIVAELGPCRGGAHRVAEQAQVVDQAAIERLRSRPDAPLGDGVDLVRRRLPAPGRRAP